MLLFCVKKIPSIIFKFISKDELDDIREKHKSRYGNVKTIPGTRSFHQFVHIGDNKLGTKYCSNDETYATVHSFDTDISFEQEITSVGCYVAVASDDNWWV